MKNQKSQKHHCVQTMNIMKNRSCTIQRKLGKTNNGKIQNTTKNKQKTGNIEN